MVADCKRVEFQFGIAGRSAASNIQFSRMKEEAGLRAYVERDRFEIAREPRLVSVRNKSLSLFISLYARESSQHSN